MNIDLKALKDQRRKEGHRIDENWKPSVFYERGVRAAETYWNSADRHPTTTIRRIQKEAKTTREWLDAQYGFQQRLQEIDDHMAEDPSLLNTITTTGYIGPRR